MAKLEDWDGRIGRRITLRDLHILSQVVRRGSMAKAATELATSQSVISDSVANLENALGVRLLDRSTKGIEPTIYAAALLKRGHAAFDELRQGIKDIEALAGSTAGEVRIACTEILAAGLISDAVDDFSRRHPDAICCVVDMDSTTLDYRQLRERRVDLMVTRIPPGFSDDEVNAEILFDDPHFIVAHAKSAWTRRRDLTLADLVEAPWIFPASQIVIEILRESFAAEGLKMPAEKVVTSFILLRHHLLATGRFITVLPESVLRYTGKQQGLRALPMTLQSKPRPIAVLTLRNRSTNPVTAHFIETLRAVVTAYARGGA